jgi:predicted dienelactone hydrolase
MSPSVLLLTVLLVAPQSSAYDPLASESGGTIVDTEFSYGDDNRVVPLRIYLPKLTEKAAVILYSHGLGGSRDAGTYLGKHWSGRGYVVVPRQKLQVLKAAANGESAQARYRDVSATIDHLQTLNQPGATYAGRFDLQKIGMSGHSFGAVTTQAVSGQKFGLLGQKFTDQRIKAAVAFSPSPPSFGNASDAFGGVAIPWMLMTGTHDQSFIARTTPEQRRDVFQHLPQSGHSYQLVLEGAEHEAFGDERPSRLLSGSKRNPNHHKAIRALSTAFWDTYLQDNVEAKAWLNGEAAKGVLQPADIWQKK